MAALRIVLNVVLFFLAAFLCYALYKNMQEFIFADKEMNQRKELTIDKLTTLKNVQLAHKSKYGRYASTADSLLLFMQSDSITYERKIGDPNDSTVVARVEEYTRSVLDTLFEGDNSAPVELMKVPSGGGKNFDVQAGSIEKNEVQIPAFEISTPYRLIYSGIKEKFFLENKDEDIRVGSMIDGTTSGNW